MSQEVDIEMSKELNLKIEYRHLKIHLEIETEPLYRVEPPTDNHQSVAISKATLSDKLLINTISHALTLVLIFFLIYVHSLLKKLLRMPVKDTTCKENNKKNDNKTAVSESVRQNIQLIESDLIVSESNLVDELQTNAYLSEEEANKMKSRNRSDQAHIFAEILEVMDDINFLRIVDILKRCSFEHIACSLQSSYENLRTQVLAITSHQICVICRLGYEVDIKDLRCGLKKEELLPFSIYIDINACLARRGHQNYLWERLLNHLKSFENESVENKFIKLFDTPRHKGLYECFIQKFPTHFECSCVS